MSFYLAVKKLMIIQNSVVETQNPIMNHESQTVKSNPGIISRFNSNSTLCYHNNQCLILSMNKLIVLWDCLQISLLTLSQFKQINKQSKYMLKTSSNLSVGRVFLTPLFYEDLLCANSSYLYCIE